MRNIFTFFIFINILFYTNIQSAREVLIYADIIDYDSNNNIIAKGKAKIISENEIVTSDLIIINEKTNTITLPTKFKYKDEKNNYYYGSSGELDTNFENGYFQNIKILLNDSNSEISRFFTRKGQKNHVPRGVGK